MAGVLGVAWFAFGAPWASNGVRQVRAEAARTLEAAEVRRALQSTGTRPEPALATLLTQAQQMADQDTTWNLLVAAILTENQRRLAVALEPSLAPLPPGDIRFGEPELPALAKMLLAQYGVGEAELPDLPERDPWPGVDRRRRARSLLALTSSAELSEAQAQALLHVTLDALAVQVERARLARALSQALPDNVRAAVIEARYATAPHSSGGRR
jgi:hypothetical protein